jgi:hypothetical protein
LNVAGLAFAANVQMWLAARRRLLVWIGPIHRLFRTPTFFKGRPAPLPFSMNSTPAVSRAQVNTSKVARAVERLTGLYAQYIAVANSTPKAFMSVLTGCCIEGGRRHGLRSMRLARALYFWARWAMVAMLLNISTAFARLAL